LARVKSKSSHNFAAFYISQSVGQSVERLTGHGS